MFQYQGKVTSTPLMLSAFKVGGNKPDLRLLVKGKVKYGLASKGTPLNSNTAL